MRAVIAIWLGKLVIFLVRFLKIGGGSAAPGYYGLGICPNLVTNLASQIPQNIVISGTNGKTTTVRLLAHFVKHQNLKVIRNATGSNLERGIASTLIAHSNLWGKINANLGIWELDEAAFNQVVFELKPQIIVMLNVFRDQLDRYGEVDAVVKKWQDSLEKINWPASIIVNGADNHTFSLMAIPNQKFFEFRVKNRQLAQEKNLAPRRKHQDDFLAEVTKNKGLEGLEFNLKFPDEKLKINLPIPGVYHVENFLAAFSAYYLLNLPLKDINDHLQTYMPAFGRVEKIKLQNNQSYTFLIKNPTGATQVFETLAPEIKLGDHLLIVLNDNFADGKDVSWIWDAQFERLNQRQIKIICSGTRAQDLAVRLKYAGFDIDGLIVENNLKKALSEAQKGLLGRLFILPTYTALLELQDILVRQGVKSHYWKENL